MQCGCNWDGKDGLYALDGQIVVNSIESMDGYYSHGKDFQSYRPIRSQTLYPLSYGALLEKQEDCIFLEVKSQEMQLVGCYFWCF